MKLGVDTLVSPGGLARAARSYTSNVPVIGLASQPVDVLSSATICITLINDTSYPTTYLRFHLG